ncbi:hypothetical protein JCM11641_003432 [Rhodosporidiobolus odoratus]
MTRLGAVPLLSLVYAVHEPVAPAALDEDLILPPVQPTLAFLPSLWAVARLQTPVRSSTSPLSGSQYSRLPEQQRLTRSLNHLNLSSSPSSSCFSRFGGSALLANRSSSMNKHAILLCSALFWVKASVAAPVAFPHMRLVGDMLADQAAEQYALSMTEALASCIGDGVALCDSEGKASGCDRGFFDLTSSSCVTKCPRMLSDRELQLHAGLAMRATFANLKTRTCEPCADETAAACNRFGKATACRDSFLYDSTCLDWEGCTSVGGSPSANHDTSPSGAFFLGQCVSDEGAPRQRIQWRIAAGHEPAKRHGVSRRPMRRGGLADGL